MKETIFDVLMYLFENHAHTKAWGSVEVETLVSDLAAAGFNKQAIKAALGWLDGLTHLQQNECFSYESVNAIRVYNETECLKLNVKARGLILFLEQIGILNANTRELVIDRALALPNDTIHLSQLKWLILIVLFNYPGQEAQLSWMEEYILDEGKHNGLH